MIPLYRLASNHGETHKTLCVKRKFQTKEQIECVALLLIYVIAEGDKPEIDLTVKHYKDYMNHQNKMQGSTW